MTLIGITGGIGSGKSFVARLLQKYWGIPIYDCDSEAKRLNEEDPSIRNALTQLVGMTIYDADGRLDRPRLAQYLFANDENAHRVDAIVHPVVLRDMQQWASRQSSPVVAIESAILIESGFHTYTDFIIFVDASLETRIFRAMQRDGVGREQIEARIARQHSDEVRSMADLIVCNDRGTTAEEILKQCAPIRQLIVPQTK